MSKLNETMQTNLHERESDWFYKAGKVNKLFFLHQHNKLFFFQTLLSIDKTDHTHHRFTAKPKSSSSINREAKTLVEASKSISDSLNLSIFSTASLISILLSSSSSQQLNPIFNRLSISALQFFFPIISLSNTSLVFFSFTMSLTQVTRLMLASYPLLR